MEHDELEHYLDVLQREECYRVDEVLKQSPFETTQRVRFIGANGSAGKPQIRKLIRGEAGLGGAYERLYQAQQSGRRFVHLPDIEECYVHDDQLVVIMELVSGETLQDHVRRLGPSLDLARQVFPETCEAACEMHEAFDPPLIHRDLKPSNIIISQGGLTIIDFGIARTYKEGSDMDTMRLGTRAFAPPEQFGFGQTSVRSDVYALGMLLYFCLTGSIPDSQTLASSVDDSRIPPALVPVLQKAIAFDPAMRYASADELKAAFESAVSMPLGEQTVAAPAAVTAAMTPTVTAPSMTGKRSVLGIVWNAFVALTLALFIAASISAFVNPNEQTSANPLWFNVFGYLIVVPLAFTATAVLIADKRPIARLIPSTAQLRWWQWIARYALVVGALLICLFVGAAIMTIQKML